MLWARFSIVASLEKYLWDLEGLKQVQGQDLSHLSYPLIFLQIKSLIRKYILKQETINLVLVPANVDIATVEALRRLRRWTSKDRTIGKKMEESKNSRWLDSGKASLESSGCFLAHTQDENLLRTH